MHVKPEQRIARRERILELLKKCGSQKESEISELIGVSVPTVRGDLSVLLRQNRVCIHLSGHGYKRWSAL